MSDSFKSITVNQYNKHFVNSFDLFTQFKASIFSSFWYRLSNTVSVSYVLKGGKHYDRTRIIRYIYSGTNQYAN